MQDNWQEFDRQIQSVLQDAGEKVPGRVWRAVSSRLDSAASAALWWRWAVPAFAAAAIVAVLFLTGTIGTPVSTSGDVDILAETEVTSSQDSTAPEYLASLELTEEEPAAEAGRKAELRPSRRQIAATEPAELPEAVEEVAEEPAAIPDDSAAEERKDAAEETYDAEAASQWARIEKEENKHKSEGLKLRSMYAQGSVGGNDSNIKYGGNGISRMAPGAGSSDSGITEAGQSTYGVPFTLGLGVRFGVTDKLSIGTGVDYSLLTRSFVGSYSYPGSYYGGTANSYSGHIIHTVQYIGIPVNAYYELLQTRDDLMKVYAWGGVEADYCISNKYSLLTMVNTVIPDKAGGFQFSTALGLGLEFKLNDFLGLYADPSVRYFIPSNQPKSVRTDKPLMFNFDAGLRFNF
ncbi:MAG: outer membrane beta-barrel protein [Bacteroidales bacterium]|nr:outer membrane beta-barrel protein [Bacteroidales bacterium]